jgi:hypothetical protein
LSDYIPTARQRLAEQCLGALDNAADIVRKAVEHNKNRLSAERSFLEQYCEGSAEVLFVWGQRESCPAWEITRPICYLGYSAKAAFFDKNTWRKSVKVFERKARDIQKLNSGKQQSVLIDDIDLVEFPKFEVPSTISLKSLEVVENCGPGKMYASALDGGFKRVRIISLFEDRKVDSRFIEVFARLGDEMKGQKIERSAQIVNGITDNQRKLVWNGFLSFYSYAALPTCHVPNENEFIPHSPDDILFFATLTAIQI